MGEWDVLQEFDRLSEEKLNHNLETVHCNINEKEEDEDHSFNIDKVDELNKDSNLFGTRLFICSILLWSLLFIRETEYGRMYVSMLTEMMTTQIELEPVQQLVDQLTIAIQQII